MYPKLLLRFTLILTLLSAASFCFSQTFTHPFSELADPNIVYHNGWYYYMGTAGNGVKMRRAQTLEGLKSAPLKMVFSGVNGGPCCAYWAPELHRINNKWYIYFTANDQGPITGQRMWVAENSADNPMEGSWVSRGRLYDTANDFWAIDGTVFQLNGQLYYVYSGVAAPQDGDKPQRIYITRMSNPWTISGQRVHLTSPWFSFETDGLVNEGPAVLHRNGKVFLTYSGSGCWTPNYAIGMLWMDEWEDPMNSGSWEKLDHAVFSKHPERNVYGPGHHSFFMSPDGSEVWMTYHATAKAGGACDASRLAHAKKIDFDANGFPVFGIPWMMGWQHEAPSGERAVSFNKTLVNGVYKIKPLSTTNKVLDVAGCSVDMGANVHQWTDSGADCQKWLITATEDGHYWIGSVKGGMTLEVEGCSTDNAANVRMWGPNGAGCQKWDIKKNDDGSFRIINSHGGKALDLQFGGDNNGANLQTYEYLGNPQQNFELTLLDMGPRIANGTYEIVNKNSNMALDLTNCSQDNGANIIQYHRLNNDCQKFEITENGHGFYRILAAASAKSLDASGCATTPGTNVQQWEHQNNDCQSWHIRHVKNGWYTIISKASGLALDVGGCSTEAAANVHLWNNLQNDCQLWKFEAKRPGGNGGNNDGFEFYKEAEDFFSSSAVQTEATTDAGGGLNVGWIDNADWMAYADFNVPTSGDYVIEYRVATPINGGRISLDLNAGAIQVSTVDVPNTGGWQNWQTVSATVYFDAGSYSLGIAAPVGGWNFNWFRVRSL
ncbi:Extracellular exo-alpha-(1-_5)-L-arabinofuranosidase [Thalassocella blandensis]|nr:Extracellular exo-alpha-(1->5)-L-arabinofuranosidase [Thalassocella blandensis]